MQVIKSDTGFLLYEKMFKQLMADHRGREREISKSSLNAFHMESGKLILKLIPKPQ